MEEDILFESEFHYMSEKKHIWNWARMEFFNFNDISIQEHKVLCQTVRLEHLLLCMLGKLYAAWHISFRSLLNGNCILSSASLPLLGQEIGVCNSSYCSF